MQVSQTDTVSIPELREVRGRVITPDDADYDQQRTVTAGHIDRRPAAIVRVADTGDVAAVINFVRDRGIELAVRCGGHSGAGHSVTDGGIVLDLREMRAIDIDVAGRTAWAEGGSTAIEVTNAVWEHGLAIGFGDTGSVGIGGLTTGGGVGYLVRKHGLTIDSLLAAEIVTADGQLLHVDAETHPDLFWAIRGGGGNFGVVTRFQYRLQPLTAFVGGMLLLPATPETIAGFIAANEAAPEELSAIANVMPAPPMPFLPEEVHGKLTILAMMAYAGEPDAAEQALAPFRELAEPMADMVKPMPYPEMYPPEDDSYRPKAAARTMFLDHVDLDTAKTIVEQLNASDASMRVAQLRVLGGAMARVPADATAFAHRSSRIMVNLAAFWEGDDRAQRESWVDAFMAAIDQGDSGAYVNFVGEEGAQRVHDAYPAATYDRLAGIKGRYDPTNLFRLNQNIPPA
ncbi:MAG TPA: FAD-binding oxidoreductase [Candidatus Limnocylindria bacterium]|nr:FAD-binding oxidoreductase [Candidatus Limnocylindria bacterium]